MEATPIFPTVDLYGPTLLARSNHPDTSHWFISNILGRTSRDMCKDDYCLSLLLGHSSTSLGRNYNFQVSKHRELKFCTMALWAGPSQFIIWYVKNAFALHLLKCLRTSKMNEIKWFLSQRSIDHTPMSHFMHYMYFWQFIYCFPINIFTKIEGNNCYWCLYIIVCFTK